MMQILDEWRHITKGTFIVLILVVPLAVAAAFGYVYKNNSVREVPLAVVNLDASQYVQVLDVYSNFLRQSRTLKSELNNPIGILSRTLPYSLITCAAFYLATGAVKQIGGLRFETDWLQMLFRSSYTLSVQASCA